MGLLALLLGSALAGGLLALPLGSQGQAPPSPPEMAQLTSVQLDQLLAPVALYPDPLLGQILMAATYPLEVVQSDRWLQDPANAALRGQQLLEALQQQPWDASVKSLVAFPQVLSALDANLSWTEELGDAFIAQPEQLMDRVQQLRARAQAARTLVSTPQQVVSNVGPDIEIEPAEPDTVYVPEYDPNVVYGAWPYYDNPPDDFELPDYAPGGFIAFVVVAPLWGWNTWNWRHHRIDIGPGMDPARPKRPAGRPGPWQHDPQHRHGVPYRYDTARAPSAQPSDVRAATGQSRGFAPAPAPAMPGRAAEFRGFGAAPAPAVPMAPGPMPQAAATVPRGDRTPVAHPEPHNSSAPRAAPPAEVRPAPPALESFGRGAQVHIQEQRGAESRQSSPAPGGRDRQ